MALLLEKWNNENWGEQYREEPMNPGRRMSDEGDSSESSRKKSRSGNKSASASADAALKRLYVAPTDDKVWGVDGIMHGIALNVGGGNTSRISDPRYIHEKRDPKRFGNNGLTNGDWFPFQNVALFRGAHGHSQAGIHGDATMGAYSIVVSGGYDEFDRDESSSLWYCGPRSDKNTDPRLPAPSSGTQALYTSKETGKDVRVLRSGGGNTAWSPEVGIRYDGLYRVMSSGTTTNTLGGRVERFKLVRNQGQPPIDTSRPTLRERNTLARIQQVSPRGWTVWG